MTQPHPVCPKCYEGVNFTITIHRELSPPSQPIFVQCGTCNTPIGAYDQLPVVLAEAGSIPQPQPEELAQKFHEAYERLAPEFSYETRKASAKPWAEVPENNRKLMIAVCAEILHAGVPLQKADQCSTCGVRRDNHRYHRFRENGYAKCGACGTRWNAQIEICPNCGDIPKFPESVPGGGALAEARKEPQDDAPLITFSQGGHSGASGDVLLGYRGIGREDAGSPAERQQTPNLHNEGSSPSSPSNVVAEARSPKETAK